MAGVPDIPVVKQVVDRISDAAADAIFRGFRYLFCYKNEMENVLKSEMENVKNVEDKVNQETVQERANGNTIKPHVVKWLKEAKEFQESSEEFSERYKNRASCTCLKCVRIPNPISRFRLGREAARTTKMAIDLVSSGEKLLTNQIADPPPFDNLPNPAVEFEDFASRKYVYRQLWEALVTEGSSRILGIYGMPGVGKTRMMEQLWKEAMEKKKFDKVVRANVGSEVVNVLKLQDQIGADLNCKFDPEDNENRRAARLKNSLMNSKRVLVIFDDVWSEIPIENIIGTEFGESSSSKGSKILLTSRREDVCLKNKCQIPVHITTLTDEEAWDLFQKTIGTDHIYDLQDDNLAKKVCTKCAGLPLLIRAVGKALEFMSPNHHVWKDALSKLEKGNFKNIAGIDPQVYACVKLSIDALQEDAKLCLFMCSLFPEDADIHIATLIQFAIGSQLILDGESAIPTMVDVLTKSSLLLECDEDHITRMHDIIRDVARFEASEGSKYKFFHVKSGGSRLTYNAGHSTSKLSPKLLRLDVEGDQVHFPDSKYLDPTDLNTLWLQCNNHLQQFPGDFFGIFENLGFLILQQVHSLPEHFSLEPLDKLNMLIFGGCDIRKTDVRLFPKNLNTLCIWDCHPPSPLDLSNLKNLLKLDIQQELPEVVMVQNAISRLSRLEEMHIPNGIRFSDDANGVTPILDEISKLTCLRSIKIYFRDFEPCQGNATFKMLSKYDISVGRRTNREALPMSTKIIELNDVEVKGDEGIQSLLERAEKVTLRSTDVDVSSICKSNGEAFTDLRKLAIASCHRVEYLAMISQNEIWHGRQLRASFSKLTMLTIKDCTAMKYLFCKSVAKCLAQLQELDIDDCHAMEAIVMDEGTSDGEIIDFSKLRRLRLEGLKSLRSFYRKNKGMHRGSTDNSVISCAQFPPLFDEMVAFPSLEYLDIKSLKHNCIWGNSVTSTSFCKLKDLGVYECRKLESVIPVSMLNRLHNLEHLTISACTRLRNAFPPCIARDLIRVKKIWIWACRMMTEIIGGGGDQQKEKEITDYGDHHIIVFPMLTELNLIGLLNLSSFWGYQSGESNSCKVEFSCLEKFDVQSCGEINLEVIEFGREDSTCQLKYLRFRSNKQMHLPCKWKLHFHNLKGLQLRGCWWHELKSLHFPNLKDLEVSDCGRSALFTISDFRTLKQLQTLKISDCDILEEIVEDVKGDELDEMDTKTIIELLQLNSVDFENLPNLRSFMGGANYECYMPALTVLKVNNCELSSLFFFRDLQQPESMNFSKLKTLWLVSLPSPTSFYRKKREMHSALMDSSVFDGMVAFPSLEELIIEDLEITDIWGEHNSYNNIVSSSFCKLERLEIKKCSKLESVIPVGMLDRLQSLEYLNIEECSSLRNALPSCFSRDIVSSSFCKLKRLEIKKCSKLESVIPISMLDRLQNLAYLNIEECSSLRNALPSCFARDRINLQEVNISGCDMMREIIGGVDQQKEKDHDLIIVFPELTMLKLVNLKNLTTFWCYQGQECDTCTYKVKFPTLTHLCLESCGEINLEAIELGGDDSTCPLKSLCLKNSGNQMLLIPCKWQLQLHNLETLKVRHCWWHDVESLRFPKLKVLQVENYIRRSALFTISSFKSLKQLQTLKISDCDLLEEIVEDVRGDEMDTKTIIELLHLNSVDFENLPKLRSFMGDANNECYMPALTELKVNKCVLSSLFFFGDLQQPESMIFSKLKTLWLVSLPSPTSFYRKKTEMHSGLTGSSVISSVQFQRLFDGMVAFPSLIKLIIEDLEITDIWGEHNSNNNIVSSSSFCKLKKLEVKKCSKLESVIPVGMLDRLHNLEDLNIEECSSLRNAFPPCIARDLINLQQVNISGCDMMREIIGGVDQQKEKEITGDRDLIIVFPELTMLKLVNLKNLTTFWCNQGPECNIGTYKVKFATLAHLCLESCGEINLEAIELGGDDSTCPLNSLCLKNSGNQMLLIPCKWQLQLHNLETLKVRHCWWHDVESLRFPKLKVLEVENYVRRSALFTISGFGSLQQLEILKISDCDLLEEIVEDVRGDEMDTKTVIDQLLQLDSIDFENLPKLRSFMGGANYECYMPALTELKVNKCVLSSLFFFGDLQQPESMIFSKLKTLRLVSLPSPTSFYRKKTEMHSGSMHNSIVSCVQFQPLFDGMVAFPSLEELIIEDLEITDIWGEHNSNNNIVSSSSSSSSSFCKLEWLEVKKCSKLESVIPVGMLDRLQNLEYLNIEEYSSLRNAFPPCIARNLILLDEMEISSCGMMTEIIGGGDQQKEKEISDNGDHHIIVFPKLTKLYLEDLENLTSFWGYQSGKSNRCKVQFPSLVEFELSSCGVINLEAIEFCRDDSTCPLESIYIESESHMQLPCKWQRHLYNLETLTLTHCWWHELKSLCFPKLKELEVFNCGHSALFTISGFGSLQQLEILKISDCDLLEEIVEDVKGDEMDTKTVIELLQLDSIDFENLPKLRSFMGGANYECYMPALTELKVNKCVLSSLFFFGDLQQPESMIFSKLKTLWLVSLPSPTSFYRKKTEMHSGSMHNSIVSCVQFQPLFDGMVAFPSLEELIIEDLEITDIWGEHNSNNNIVSSSSSSSSSFCKLEWLEVKKCSKLESVIPVGMLDRLQNLEYLNIEECSSLRNAFPPCIARNLILLDEMEISSCGMMTEIIGGGDQQKEKEISDNGDHHIIVFPKLTKLYLEDLENLTSFWGHGKSNRCKVRFPSLVEFELRGCEVINLEAIEFCRDDSTCPLESIYIESENHMQLPCKWQRHLYNLETLTLTHCWWPELKSLCFPKLQNLEVSNCGRSALFTISGFGSLQQLQTLDVSNCALLEEIVEDVRGDGHDEMDKKTVIELLQLDSVVFKDLPNLKSFTHGANYKCYMPALKKMEFDNCGLSSLFTCSVFRNLQQLHQLVVSNCRLLEAIVEDGRGDGETSDTNDKFIIHSNLFSVTLEDLPHLSSFSCSESYAFNMSGLKEIYLLKCPQLKNLNEIKASTKIISVHTEHGDEEATDLNDFITKHRKRGSNLVALLENQVTNQELETDSGILEEGKHQEG